MLSVIGKDVRSCIYLYLDKIDQFSLCEAHEIFKRELSHLNLKTFTNGDIVKYLFSRERTEKWLKWFHSTLKYKSTWLKGYTLEDREKIRIIHFILKKAILLNSYNIFKEFIEDICMSATFLDGLGLDGMSILKTMTRYLPEKHLTLFMEIEPIYLIRPSYRDELIKYVYDSYAFDFTDLATCRLLCEGWGPPQRFGKPFSYFGHKEWFNQFHYINIAPSTQVLIGTSIVLFSAGVMIGKGINKIS